MTETLERPAADAPSAADRADAWLSAFEEALAARDVDARGRHVRHRELLARPGLLHLEPHDRREPARASPTCSRRPSTAPTRPASPRASRPTRTAGSSPRGSPSRPPSAAAPGCCAWSRRTARTGPSPSSPPSTSSRATRSQRRGRRPMGAEHGADKQPRHVEGAAPGRRPRASARPPSPTCSSSAAARAASPSAARLRQLGVPALVIDKHPRPGDQWRNRYKSLCLHDPVWYDHLPYLKFPDNWPVFAPKDKIGDWLESYVKVMEVPYWSSTEATSATWSEETGEWTVEVEREGRAADAAPDPARLRDRDVRQAADARDRRAWTSSRATCTTPRAPRAGRLPPARGPS